MTVVVSVVVAVVVTVAVAVHGFVKTHEGTDKDTLVTRSSIAADAVLPSSSKSQHSS